MGNNINEILAKSDGTTLITHSTLVSKFAVEIAKQSLLEYDSDLIEGIKIGGLLHDVGKCLNSFQKKLKSKTNLDDNNIEIKLPYRHNEIGWSFLNRNLNLKNTVLKIVLDTVYWHHGISNKMSGYKDTDINISESDLNIMTQFTKMFLGDVIKEKPYKPKLAPQYYVNDVDDDVYINARNTFARTCVMSADRLVSSLNRDSYTDVEISDLVKTSSIRKTTIDVNQHLYNGNSRFSYQKNILNDVDKTTVIKAPAGFGKTLLGLLWSFSRDKKLIWVCPRNIVATSVYDSIINELNNFGENNISVELFLTNEVVKKNISNCTDSDIIVTNIDNFLSPSVDNRNAHKLQSIINYDVIFDEHHELIGDTALNACFVNIMSIRHQITKSNTLLLSATPTNIHILWDTINCKTTILPNKNTHYPAPHNKKYKLNILSEFPKEVTNNASLFIFNSIGNAQENKVRLNNAKLFHSSFTDNDKSKIIKWVYDNYGKKTIRIYEKPNLVGTHVVQASLDISFSNLYESFLSPESTLQRVGRCDRWGDYSSTPSINIINYVNRSENMVRDILYTVNLSNMWLEFISKYNGEELTLDKLYILYNEFNNNNSKILNEYIINKHSNSLKALSNIHPVKFYEQKIKSVVKTAGGNKLRSSGLDTFIISKIYNSEEYCDPFNVSIYKNHGEDFNEEGNIRGRLLSTMKSIRNINDGRFNYNEIINNEKNITIDKIRQMGKKSDTPYIRFDKVYHPELGLISESKLINIINNLYSNN